MNTVCLFIPAKNKYLNYVRGIITMLSTGYTVSNAETIMPYLVLDEDKEEAHNFLEKVSEIILNYNQLQSQIHSFYNGPFFLQKVSMPKLLCGRSCEINDFFLPNRTKDVLHWLSAMLVPEIDNLSKDDRFVGLVRDFDDFPMLAALQVKARQLECSNGAVCSVPCEFVVKSEIQEPIASSLDFFNEIYSNLIITGRRKDVYQNGFTEIQTLIALMDMMSNDIKGEPTVTGVSKGMNYQLDNIPSEAIIHVVERAVMLKKLHELVGEPKLKPWRERTMTDPCDLWSSHSVFELFLWMLDNIVCWEETIKHKSGFSFTINGDIEQAVVTSMNNVERIKASVDHKSRRQIRLLSMLNSVFSAIPNIINKPAVYLPIKDSCYSQEPKIPDFFFSEKNVQEQISPTAIMSITEKAFEEKYLAVKNAKMFRSNCLDFWMLFYEKTQKEINSLFSIKEILIDKDDLKELLPILSLTEIGKTVVEEKIWFLLKDLSGNNKGITSPLTGFACCPCQSAQIYDLCERPIEFQRFIYVYLSLFPTKFSKVFRNYVIRSVNGNRADFDAVSKSIFSLGPKFQKHIGIYFNNGNL